MPESVTLYYMPGACSLAPHIALYDLDIPHELLEVERGTKKVKQTGDDFLKINPKGYVPTMSFPNGDVHTEGAIILQRLADMRLEKHLLPACGTTQRYKVLEWLHFVATEVHKAFGPFFAMPERNAWHTFVEGRLKQRCAFIDQQLSTGKFLMGDQYTIADIYLFVCLSWNKKVQLDLGDIPNIRAFEERMMERESVQKAMKAEGLIS